jgi:hypothetical protein
MATVAGSKIATFLGRLKFEGRKLNRGLTTVGKIDYQALEIRLNMSIVNDREVIESVLDGKARKTRKANPYWTFCRALKINKHILASGMTPDTFSLMIIRSTVIFNLHLPISILNQSSQA